MATGPIEPMGCRVKAKLVRGQVALPVPLKGATRDTPEEDYASAGHASPGRRAWCPACDGTSCVLGPRVQHLTPLGFNTHRRTKRGHAQAASTDALQSGADHLRP